MLITMEMGFISRTHSWLSIAESKARVTELNTESPD